MGIKEEYFSLDESTRAGTQTFLRPHLMCEGSDAAIDSLNQNGNEERNHNSNLTFSTREI